jgi:hypothetical protein
MQWRDSVINPRFPEFDIADFGNVAKLMRQDSE